MSLSEPAKCPVCGTPLVGSRRSDQGFRIYFDCPQCGPLGLTRPAEFTLDTLLTSPRKRAVLSYGIQQTPHRGSDTKVLEFETCKKIVDADILPTPQEAAENLIRWLGAHLAGPGDILKINFHDHGKFAEAQSESGFFFVVDGLLRSGLLHGQRLPGSIPFAEVTLSFSGWERFEQLRRGTPSGRKAFMAMEYDDPVLDQLVNAHFRAAVAETGFVLRRLDDEPRAGLIDDRLRVEIQSSRFLIADLTHRNA